MRLRCISIVVYQNQVILTDLLHIRNIYQVEYLKSEDCCLHVEEKSLEEVYLVYFDLSY